MLSGSSCCGCPCPWCPELIVADEEVVVAGGVLSGAADDGNEGTDSKAGENEVFHKLPST